MLKFIQVVVLKCLYILIYMCVRTPRSPWILRIHTLGKDRLIVVFNIPSCIFHRSLLRTQMWGVSMTLRTSKVAALLLLSVHLLHASTLPAASSYEFNAYRMQQFNLHQDKHGNTPQFKGIVHTKTTVLSSVLIFRVIFFPLPNSKGDTEEGM